MSKGLSKVYDFETVLFYVVDETGPMEGGTYPVEGGTYPMEGGTYPVEGGTYPVENVP
ncbi:hypothetical protein [Aquisalibacillus elongatus]|uniref:hypothetical protein n=1 Tax=Aquisalibacillus elongatus TaxID=485577 RepID=UPI00147411E5|nr:hypothetical protein [Aquisalibacillus elongatus]